MCRRRNLAARPQDRAITRPKRTARFHFMAGASLWHSVRRLPTKSTWYRPSLRSDPAPGPDDIAAPVVFSVNLSVRAAPPCTPRQVSSDEGGGILSTSSNDETQQG